MNASFKDTTPNAIRELHEDGICIVMLTGDNQTPPTRSADVWESTRPSRRSYQTKRLKPSSNCRIRGVHNASFEDARHPSHFSHGTASLR